MSAHLKFKYSFGLVIPPVGHGDEDKGGMWANGGSKAWLWNDVIALRIGLEKTAQYTADTGKHGQNIYVRSILSRIFHRGRNDKHVKAKGSIRSLKSKEKVSRYGRHKECYQVDGNEVVEPVV